MMGLQYAPLSPPLTPCTTQKTVQRILSCSRLAVVYSENLSGHLHCICTLRLSNDSRLILKTSPSPSAYLLRSEYQYLDTEATTLELLATSSLPIPRVVKYERRCSNVSSALLLETQLSGTRYADVKEYLTKAERTSIEKQIFALRALVHEHRSFTFGPAGLVKAGEGYNTWREAYVAMLDTLLMDGEDMMVNLPYFQIREAVSRWESYLDDVTEARLVVPGLGEPENTLIDRRSNEVTGLLDFGRAVWGDLALTEDREQGDIKDLL